MAGGWQVGLDIGGTFTDVIAIETATGSTRSAKVKSQPNDPLRGLLAGLAAVGLDWREVGDLIHGTTIVTNAIVEGRLARVALVATQGFSDVLAIGRQNRRHLYRLDLPPKLPPQVPEALRFEVEERLTHQGHVVVPLTEAAIEALVARVREAGVEAVAICLLHAYANPEHEEALGRRLAEVVGHVSLSHRVNPEAREFERTSTTALSAGVTPLVADYVDRLRRTAPAESRLHVFHSASGMCSPDAIRQLPLSLALSGPAAGVAAASQVARTVGISRAISFDMGGTTTDVCLIVDGKAEIAADRSLAGRPLRMPAVAVESIGAGGGSLARFDGDILRIGPESAGADPGPACYGLGGTEPTISDADMVLGYLNDGATFGEDIRLDRAAAEKAMAPLASALGRDLTATAAGILRVGNNTMSSALRRVTVEQGIDARGCTLIAFGGAGPMHAVEVARIVGIRNVIIPDHSSTFSALGCATAEHSYTQQQTIRMASTDWDHDRLTSVQQSMREGLAALFPTADPATPVFSWTAGMRYLGQTFSVEIPDPELDRCDRLREAFAAKHALLYGFASDGPFELTTLRLAVAVLDQAAALRRSAPTARGCPTPTKTRICSFEGALRQETPEYRRADLSPGSPLAGPAIVTDAFSTIVLPPDSSLETDRHGHLHITLEAVP